MYYYIIILKKTKWRLHLKVVFDRLDQVFSLMQQNKLFPEDIPGNGVYWCPTSICKLKPDTPFVIKK